MVEQTHTGERHYHAVLITALNDCIVADGAAGLCNILNTAALCTLDVIAEGEECIRAEGYTVDGIEVCSLLITGEGAGCSVKYFCQLPSAQTSSSFWLI